MANTTNTTKTRSRAKAKASSAANAKARPSASGKTTRPSALFDASNAVEPSDREGGGVELDAAGAPHQTTGDGHTTLITQQGAPVSDDQSHLRISPRGPMSMEDFH